MPDSQVVSNVEALFNPAFCASLGYQICRGHQKKTDSPLPLAYMYLAIPSALHKATREALPRSTASSMHTWLKDNPLILMDMEVRVRNLRSRVSAAITFAVQHGVLINVEGDLIMGYLARRPQSLHPTADWESCMKSAEFLGKWFGVSGTDQATVLAGWGFRP